MCAMRCCIQCDAMHVVLGVVCVPYSLCSNVRTALCMSGLVGVAGGVLLGTCWVLARCCGITAAAQRGTVYAHVYDSGGLRYGWCRKQWAWCCVGVCCGSTTAAQRGVVYGHVVGAAAGGAAGSVLWVLCRCCGWCWVRQYHGVVWTRVKHEEG